jgi:hypothetical protein
MVAVISAFRAFLVDRCSKPWAARWSSWAERWESRITSPVEDSSDTRDATVEAFPQLGHH